MKHPLIVLLLVLLLTPFTGKAQSEEYYVTIGVFAIQNNALKWTNHANKAGFQAQYAINPARKLYYVYLFQSTDKRKAYAFAIKMRLESEFKDAWVFTGRLGENTEAAPKPEPKPETKPAEVKPEPVVEQPQVTQPVVEQPVVETPVVKKDSVVKPTVEPPKKKVAKGKFFMFRLVNKDNGQPIKGEIHLLLSKRASQYQAFRADTLVDLGAPRNPDGVYFVTTIAPGYQSLETVIDYKDPLPSSSGTGPDGELIIPFELTRAKRGDYIEFTNVSFYRNSVVMHPRLQPEIDGLIDLMKEHPNYKIRIHAHCNGTEPRDITTLGTSTKYFESDPGNKKMTGTAKELTELRAEAARRYLVSQGIAVERILTKGEGGKMMVYPQNSVYSSYNDRLEIEVIRH